LEVVVVVVVDHWRGLAEEGGHLRLRRVVDAALLGVAHADIERPLEGSRANAQRQFLKDVQTDTTLEL
jgi:hypothetical protein